MSVASHSLVSPAGAQAGIGAAWYERRHKPWLSELAYERVKRAIDILFALMSLPVAIPVLLACAAAIRIDSRGPAFFAQRRTGRGGKLFRMFKLRTMVQNADAIKKDLLHLNQLRYPDFKIADDPRITRVGRFLRRSSLDELPQVFNVLRGDMSLVGPRPTSFNVDTYKLWHTERLALKPGLTGLWQVSGRNELQFDERVRLDIAYRRNRCFGLDLQILARTVTSVLTARGAN